MTTLGLRNNAGKPRWDLLPYNAVAKVVDVLTFGASKYAPRNWEKGLSFADTFASLQRHAIKWYNGEENDDETGIPHMAHVATNALFLVYFGLTGKGKDDRPGKEQDANDAKPSVPSQVPLRD